MFCSINERVGEPRREHELRRDRIVAAAEDRTFPALKYSSSCGVPMLVASIRPVARGRPGRVDRELDEFERRGVAAVIVDPGFGRDRIEIVER